VEYTSRSSGLLRVEASLARVLQSNLKTGGDATMDGACGMHHRGGCVGGKLKRNGSIRWVVSESVTLPLLFSIY
jgi:hypothetical protein